MFKGNHKHISNSARFSNLVRYYCITANQSELSDLRVNAKPHEVLFRLKCTYEEPPRRGINKPVDIKILHNGNLYDISLVKPVWAEDHYQYHLYTNEGVDGDYPAYWILDYNPKTDGIREMDVRLWLEDYLPRIATSDDLFYLPFGGGEGENSAVLNNLNNKASGEGAIAVGKGSNAIGNYSLSEGNSVASGDFSHAEGGVLQDGEAVKYPKAIGYASHAEGKGSHAGGEASHSEGIGTDATQKASHAEGEYTIASGRASHSEGNKSVAQGQYSHAEGSETNSAGNIAHAEGKGTHAKGRASHAEGWNTQTNNEGEHAEGRFNISHAGATIHSVGIGTSDSNRANAHEIDNEGRHYIYGVGGYDGNNLDDANDVASVIDDIHNKFKDLPLTLRYTINSPTDTSLGEYDSNKAIYEYLWSLSEEELKVQNIRAILDGSRNATLTVQNILRYVYDSPIIVMTFKSSHTIETNFVITARIFEDSSRNSISFNIDSLSYVVRTYWQELSDEEQNQARENIGAQQSLTLTVKDNGNIVIGNLAGQTKEFMPATPSGDPMHYMYEMAGATYNATGADITKTGYYGDTYVHKTGYWDLNEVGDMTNEDMRYTLYKTGAAITANNYIEAYSEDSKLRTNIWNARNNVFSATGTSINCAETFFNSFNIESIYWYPARINQIYYMFARTSSSSSNKLKKIFGVLNMHNVTNTNNIFRLCGNLQYFRMSELNVNLDINWTSVVSLCSLQYLVEHATNTSAITVTVHPDVYAKLTDETNSEWYAVNTAAVAKNIAFATA